MQSSSLLMIQNLGKSFGGVKALDGVNMEVAKGSVTMLIGPNGSGKTTLINVVSGFLKPDGGNVIFDGHDITGLPPHRICQMGLVRTFQIPSPFTKLTVLENLLVASKVNPGESFLKASLKKLWIQDEERLIQYAFKLLEFIELDHLWNEPASTLSGGQMKLLEIGRALMNGAKAILMDEPMAGVNPVLANNIFSHVLKLRDTLGVTLLIVEHRLDLVLPYADYAYFMCRGRVLAEGRPNDVINNPIVTEAYLAG